MPIALAPEAAASCTPNTPRPPEAPHTRTLSPGLSVWGDNVLEWGASGGPHQHVVAWLERVGRMTEQHAIGGRERKGVAGRLFPGEVPRLLHQLARLNPTELRERTVRRLVTPDALGGREQRIAAVALLVVPVVLVAMDDDLVAYFPAPHLAADRPHDAGGVGARHVERILVNVVG